ncbi:MULTISPECIES: glycosyltransferase [unclassified Pedobacter]|uniref:glycosyltransferase n=1 Tax=unclassified Pedobacter TaxID=2628915 RepID=UPI0014245319|nr:MULTISPECIES: glycosyltransferase [unclassified Pedobacter]NII81636.1 glycosyltransferase involved in cell wall biosynthesis [Pedobacter sp. SG908]NMN35640.1 glycosyltransferase involved in cell wall biosynthesis [Pedobacter sp. SG918]
MNTSTKKLLIIGLVWPEPTSSAAGTRMIQLIDLFLSKGYQIVFASAASKSDFSYDFSKTNVFEQQIKLNDESFNVFLKKLNPDLVLFDRFMVEEQYGWRVQQECPNALKVLDTEDLHCLRSARQQSDKKKQVLDLFSDTAKREIASILRCDLSLIISEVEMDMLKTQFKIDASLIYYLPFLEKEITQKDIANWISYEERADFVFIGNFLHEPNWNTVQFLKTKVWPVLRKRLPGASLNIFGSYASQKVLQLDNKNEKFLIKGRAVDAKETIAKHRILLAPIQFGAGVKGKFIDAMHVGTPSVTTSVGAEAMKGNLDWNGSIEDNLALFIDEAVKLYQDKNAWQVAQQNGVQIINKRYSTKYFTGSFILELERLISDLTAHRQNNFFGQILNHHTAQSTKYMSLWIEEKNRK